MSSSRKKLTLNTVSINIGCGSCTKPKLHHIFFHYPKPKPKSKNSIYQKHNFYQQKNHKNSSYDSSTTTTTTKTTTNSPHYYAEPSSNFSEHNNKKKNNMKKTKKNNHHHSVTESVAVEKDSEDPYLDFKQSMLQMILENEIYTKDGLRELLNCFLQLNSPNHHGVIVRAFTEIWNGVFSVRSNSSPRFHFTKKS